MLDKQKCYINSLHSHVKNPNLNLNSMRTTDYKSSRKALATAPTDRYSKQQRSSNFMIAKHSSLKGNNNDYAAAAATADQQRSVK